MHQIIEETAYPSLDQLYDKCYARSTTSIASLLHYIFKAGFDEISVDGETLTVFDLSRMQRDNPPTQLIWFWGGPEDNQDWFSGTLVTMLLDRYYYNLFEKEGDISSSLELLRALK